jgi:mannitol-specific phosphotransferase system IIBC component
MYESSGGGMKVTFWFVILAAVFWVLVSRGSFILIGFEAAKHPDIVTVISICLAACTVFILRFIQKRGRNNENN